MLAEKLKVLLGSSFSLYLKSKQFHWNVQGKNFYSNHKFLDDYSGMVYDTIDRIAEFIRTLDQFAPGSLSRMQELSIILDQTKVPRAELMIFELRDDNGKLIQLLNEVLALAKESNDEAIVNYLGELLDSYGKYKWQFNSILSVNRD